MLFNPTKLNFKYRKILHFSLITSIVLFQILLLIIFYNEIFNEAKLDSITNQLKQAEKIKSILERSKINQFKAQANFKDFVNTNKIYYLNSFHENTASFTATMDSLSKIGNSNASWKHFLSKELHPIQTELDFKSKLDSVLQLKLPSNTNLNWPGLKLKPYNYEEVLNSIHVESAKEVDTVKKKGLFSRIGNALSGKVDVQKEKENILVTMKFGNKVSTGDVSAQLSNAFDNTNAYYAKAFSKLQSDIKSHLISQQKKLAAFTMLNLQLLNYGGELVSNYEKALADFTKAITTRFDKQYETNKTIRNFTIIGLVILVIIISVILFFFTRLAFGYEKRLYEAQLKIQDNLNFKNQIVSMISHEIKSPLSIISIYSKLLNSKIKDEEIKNVFDSIQFTTNSLYTLSSQILEFSKNENKTLKLNKKVFNLTKEFSAIKKTLKTLVESNGNVFVFKGSIPNHCKVNSDVVKIHQLLYNVIGNANKFTTKGTIKMSVQLTELSADKLNLFVEVQDTGAGISKLDLEHIFDKFYQAGVEEKAHTLGAGIGLNLCKNLVELFPGTIEVASELGKGTTVGFNLILDKANS